MRYVISQYNPTVFLPEFTHMHIFYSKHVISFTCIYSNISSIHSFIEIYDYVSIIMLASSLSTEIDKKIDSVEIQVKLQSMA